jgi:hypothetical protein
MPTGRAGGILARQPARGHSFRDPDRPGKTLRYVSEFIKGSAKDGGGSPKVTWVREGA